MIFLFFTFFLLTRTSTINLRGRTSLIRYLIILLHISEIGICNTDDHSKSFTYYMDKIWRLWYWSKTDSMTILVDDNENINACNRCVLLLSLFSFQVKWRRSRTIGRGITHRRPSPCVTFGGFYSTTINTLKRSYKPLGPE